MRLNRLLQCRLLYCSRFISQLPLQAVGAGVICDNVPGLSGKQRRMCRLHQVNIRLFKFHLWELMKLRISKVKEKREQFVILYF